jgi:hypothetical protein
MWQYLVLGSNFANSDGSALVNTIGAVSASSLMRFVFMHVALRQARALVRQHEVTDSCRSQGAMALGLQGVQAPLVSDHIALLNEHEPRNHGPRG